MNTIGEVFIKERVYYKAVIRDHSKEMKCKQKSKKMKALLIGLNPKWYAVSLVKDEEDQDWKTGPTFKQISRLMISSFLDIEYSELPRIYFKDGNTKNCDIRNLSLKWAKNKTIDESL